MILLRIDCLVVSRAQDGGPLIITLTSVPIEDLPDLSFVYGNFYKYDRYAMGAIRSVPLQGTRF